MCRILEKIVRCVFVCASILGLGFVSQVQAQTSPAITNGVQWLAAQVLPDGSLATEATSVATVLQSRSETAFTLKALSTVPGNLVTAIASETDDNTEYLARQAIAMLAAGQDASVQIKTLLQRQNDDGGFGGAPMYASNPLDTAWALIALNASGQTTTVPGALGYLQAVQQPDGSFGLDGHADIYTSAYVLSALHLYASVFPMSTVIQSTTNYLMVAQSVSGNWAKSPWITALVYQAVHDFVPLDPTASAVKSYLVSSQLADGSWGDDPYVTAVILRTLQQTGSVPSNPMLATIRGQVIDSQTGLPMTGVSVAMTGTATVSMSTGSDGIFVFQNLSPGAYGIVISIPNYGTLSTNTAVKAGQIIDFGKLRLTKATGATTGTIYGKVIDAGTGAGLAGVTISSSGMTTQTDISGSYQLLNVPAGNITFTASKTGYQAVNGAGQVYAGGSLLFSPTLSTASGTATISSTVLGIVMDAGTNSPLAGVAIVVTDGLGIHNLTTDAAGKFSAANLTKDATGGVNMVFSLAQYSNTDTYVFIDGIPSIDIGQIRLRKAQATQLLPDLQVLSVSRIGATTDLQTLLFSGNLTADIGNTGTADAPPGISVLAFYDVNGNGVYDLGVDVVLGSAMTGGGIAAGGSQTVTIPVQGTLPFRDAPLYVLADSTQQVVESNKNNNINNTSSACQATPNFAAFQPVLKWAWTGSNILSDHRQVMSMPIVVRLEDTNGDGKIDEKDIPSVIFNTFAGYNYEADGVLRAVSGKDGHELWTVTDPAYRTIPTGQIAAADIDGDGFIEIVATRSDGGIVVFDHNGKFKWQNVQPSLNFHWGGPAIADLDGNGKPDIIYANKVFSSDGVLKWEGSAYSGGNLSIVADLNMDGNPKVVAGASAYSATGQLVWQNTAVGNGMAAIANFNQDPYPEIVIVTGGRIFMLDHLGNIIWGPVAIPGGGGGPPTVGDMDGDGIPEIGVAGASFYSVFRADGSVLWSSPTQDNSQITGSSVFDFDGSGKAKVVYGDENYLRVFEGATGKVLFQIPNSSGTAFELPVIADVDNDNHADIVVATNWGNNGSGIRVYTDINNAWVNTRKIWNQHSYHITNINDDGSVPKVEQNSWQVNNSYRLNAQPGVVATAESDLTASYLRIQDRGGMTPSTFTVRVGNGGGLPMNPSVSIAFYSGKPEAGGVLLGTAKTVTTLGLGQYEDVNFSYPNALTGIRELVVAVDDDGTGKSVIQECDKSNNRVSILLSALPGSFSLTVSTDKTSYGANANVLISAPVSNNGSLDGTALVRFVIRTAQGQTVATLPIQNLPVPHTGQQTVNATWNTTITFVGQYQVTSQLVDANGAPYAEATTIFSIDAVQQNTLTSVVTTDKQSYLPSDNVQLTSRVTNTTTNQLLQNLTVVTTLNNPDGTAFVSKSENLPQRGQGSLKDFVYTIPLNFAVAGVYTVSLSVKDANGVLLASGTATFTVQSSALTGSGLTGTISVSPKQLPLGTTIAMLYSARNLGNSALANLPLKISVIDPVAQKVMAEYPTTQTLAMGGSYTAANSWTSTGTLGTNYVAVLSAVVGGKTLTLAQDTFTLIPPPIKFDISQSIPTGSRVLVLLSCMPTENGNNARSGNNVQYCGDNADNHDGHQNDGVPHPQSQCLPQRNQILTTALNALGVPYVITETVSDFKQALRSGLYNVYWISDAQYSLGKALAKELREAVYGGAGLLLEGGSLKRNSVLDSVGGVQFKSNLGKQLPINLSGTLYPVPISLPTVGQSQGLQASATALVEGNFTVNVGGDNPGNHDSHGDSKSSNARPQTQNIPGLVGNVYGSGHTLTFGFDLVTILLTQETAWQPSLATGFNALTPAPRTTPLTPGSVLPVQTHIVNQGQATDVDIQSILPTGAIYLASNPAGTYSANINTVDWTFNLPIQQSDTSFLALRVPPTAGSYTLQTLVNYVSNGNNTLYGPPLLEPITVTAAAQAEADAVQKLQGYILTKRDDRELRDGLVAEVKEVLAYFNKSTLDGYEKSIADLLDIIDRLGGLKAEDTSAVHADLDRILQEAQWRWTLFPPPVPRNQVNDHPGH